MVYGFKIVKNSSFLLTCIHKLVRLGIYTACNLFTQKVTDGDGMINTLKLNHDVNQCEYFVETFINFASAKCRPEDANNIIYISLKIHVSTV